MKYQMQNNTARLQIHAHGTHNTSIMEYWNIKNGASTCTNDLLLTFIQRTILGGSECDEGTNRGYRKEWEKWPEKKREVNRYAFEKWTKIKVQISHRQTNHKRYHPNWMSLSSLVLPSSLKSIKQKKITKKTIYHLSLHCCWAAIKRIFSLTFAHKIMVMRLSAGWPLQKRAFLIRMGNQQQAYRVCRLIFIN